MNLPAHRAAVTLLAILALTVGLSAQTAPASASGAPGTSAAAEETFVLSPFEVNAGATRGYVASRSLTATGIGSEVGEIPVNLTVLTDDFIADRAVPSISEAVKFVSGVTANDRFIDGIKIRGFDSITQRDGATQNGGAFPVDDVQQAEVLKGASSIFHGIVRPGGVVNLVTYSPRFEPKTTLFAAGGTDEYQKLLLRITGPLYHDKLAYLFTASTFHQGNTVMKYGFKDYSFVSGKLLFRPLRNVSLKLSYDNYNFDTNTGQDIVVSHPLFLEAAARGEVPAGQTAQGWVATNLGYNVPPAPAIVSAQVFPYELFDAIGPDARTNFGQETLRGDLVWDLDQNLSLRVIAQQAKISNRVYWVNLFRAPAGGVYLNSTATDTRVLQEIKDVKAELSIGFDVLHSQHKVLFGASTSEGEGRNITLLGKPINYNPLTDGVRLLDNELNAANPAGFRGRFDNRALWSLDRANGLYANDQISLFDERLRLLGGLRYTERESGRATKLKVHDTTVQAGALYDITKTISIFANYGETFEPNFSVDAVTGNTAPTSTGNGYEGGVKFALSDRYYVSASVFKTEFLQAARDFAREAVLLRTPIFFPGGQVQESSGFELDLNANPTDQFSLVLGYAYTWKAETTASIAEPRQIGVRLDNVPEHKLNVWAKYTFITGPLKNFEFGGGFDYRSKIRIHPSWEQSITDGDLFLVNLLAGYTLRRAPISYTVTLNVQNALDQNHYLDGSLSWGEGMRSSLALKIDF